MRRHRQALVALTALPIACVSITEPVDRYLSGEMFGALLSQFADPMVLVGAIRTSLADGVEPEHPGPTLDITLDCEGGGSTRVVGAIAWDTLTQSGSGSLTQTFTACRTDSSPAYTFDGDPHIVSSTALTYDADANRFDGTRTLAGAVRFTRRGETKRCSVEYDLTFTTTTVRHEQSVCGFAGDETVPR